MGNTCVGPSITKNGFFQSVSAVLWRTRSEGAALPPANGSVAGSETSPSSARSATDVSQAVQNKAPEPIMIHKGEEKATKPPEIDAKPVPDPTAAKPRAKIPQVKRVSSAGLLAGSVLKRKTENLKDIYSLGRKLGQGQFGTTYLCVEKATGKEYACKSILKRKLATEEDVEDVRREIQIMHHLAGHPNVISIKGAYEDAVAVHLVMDLCAGGELFDRIVQKGHYTERKAAELGRVIAGPPDPQ